MAAGPNTKMCFYESETRPVCAVIYSAASDQTPHPTRAVKIDGIKLMERWFKVGMGIGACKLERGQANALVARLLEKYEPQIALPPSGSTYEECYDVTTGKPSEAYLRLYGEVKEELAAMGVPCV